MKRLIALMIAAMLLIGCLSGCGKDNQSVQLPSQNELPQQDQTVQELPEEQGPVFVYASEISELVLDEAYGAQTIGSVCASGTDIYFSADCVTDSQPTTDPLYDELYGGSSTESRVFHLDPDTKTVTRLEGYTPYAVDEGWGGYVSLNGLFAGADGSVWVNELVTTFRYNLPEDFDAGEDDPGLYYEAGLRMNRLICLDKDGEVLRQIEIVPTTEKEYSGILVDVQGYIYASAWDEVSVFDPQGAFVGLLDLQGNSGEMIMLNAATIGLRCWQNGSAAFLPFDRENMSVGLALVLGNAYSPLVSGHASYQYVSNIGGVLYGHTEGAEADEKLLSLLDCDVNSTKMIGCMYLTDGRLAVLEKDDATGYGLVLIELVDASELPQRQTLTLGCVGVTETLRSYVVSFNRANEDLHITVKDYSEYNTDEDYTLGLAALEHDMLSGQGPDVIYADPQVSLERFGAAGKLLDLWAMIDGDATLSRDDLMLHFFEVLSLDGKLYQVTDSFTIQTAAGLLSKVGEGTDWSVASMQTILTDMEEHATVFGASDTSATILAGLLPLCVDQYVTWTESGVQCSFDSEAFAELLQFAAASGASAEGGLLSGAGMDHLRMTAGVQLLKSASVYDFNQIRYNELELGEPLAYVGYPVENGSWFQLSGSWAISASCTESALAWRFVRTCLTEEYQTTYTCSAFPTNRTAFEALAQKAMEPATKVDPVTGDTIVYDEIHWANHAAYLVQPLTQMQYDTVMGLYERCGAVGAQDSRIAAIITQEAAAFFNGEQSAEQAAADVQKLVSDIFR